MSGISVLMAVHNGGRYLAEAIDSVLKQTYPPAELVVVDDGSTDDTPRVLERYAGRIVHLLQSNQGQTASLNRAIAAAKGELLAFQDADDIWCAEKLEWQIEALHHDAQAEAAFGLMRQFVSPDVPEAMRTKIAPINETLPAEMRTCLLIRRTALDRIGLFNPAFPSTSFVEWLGRAKRLGLKSIMVDKVVALRRLHLGNHGRLHAQAQETETLLALRRVIADRKRTQ
jgi:glycosyltransferase involved in cell wall biosynthesis